MKSVGACFLVAVGIAGLAIAASAARLPAVSRLAGASFDLFQRMAPRPAPGASVLVVDIDTQSLREHGPWPWPPEMLAELTDKLAAAGATVIGFDFVIPVAGGDAARDFTHRNLEGEPTPAAVSPADRPDAEHARPLDDALRRASVVLGSVPGALGGTDRPARKANFAFAGEDPIRQVRSFPRAVVSAPDLEDAAAGVGSLDLGPDSDGVVRRLPLLEDVGGGAYPGFVPEILRVGLGIKSYIGLGAGPGMAALRIGPIILPSDPRGRLWIAYRAFDPERWISADDVLAGRVDASTIRDRIVLIGAAGNGELSKTPVSPGMLGIEIHAQTIDQVLQGWFLTRPAWASAAELLFIAVLALLIATTLPTLGPIKSGLIAGYALALDWGLCWWAFRSMHLLIDPFFPSLVIAAVFMSLLAISILSARPRPIGAT